MGEEFGTIIVTTDGFSTWTTIPTGLSFLGLFSMSFCDANTWYAAGRSGNIIKTINGGSNWVSQSSGTEMALFSSCFTSTPTGYAVGVNGNILKTTNGGSNWTALSGGTTNYLFSVFFTDSNTGYAAGANGTILKTTNAGANWTILSSGTSSLLYSILFTDSNTGYAVGSSGTILKTINGGANWAVQPSGTINNLRSVFFTSSNTGYIVGSNGIMLKTFDGGGPVLSVSTNSLTIAAPENSTKTLDIVSNTSWNTTIDQGWLSVNNNSGSGNATLTLTVTANPTAATRLASLTVSGIGVTSQTINVTQEGGTTEIADIITSDFVIYPNPVRDILHLSFKTDNAIIFIFDLNGKIVLEKQIHDNQIDISNLKNGAYTAKILDKTGSIIRKFIKH